MPWTMNDYPQTWKHLDELERKKAIDIANAMLKDGYKDASKEELEELKHKHITQHQKDPSARPELNDEDVHVYYEDHEWKVKTEDAKQASDTFSTKKEAKQRAKEIADNRGTHVIEHQKDE